MVMETSQLLLIRNHRFIYDGMGKLKCLTIGNFCAVIRYCLVHLNRPKMRVRVYVRTGHLIACPKVSQMCIEMAECFTNHSNVDDGVHVSAHFDRIRAQWQRAIELIPALATVEVRPAAGVMTMAPDQFPMIGPVSGLRNYWLAAGALYVSGSNVLRIACAQ
jgi:glycine/D-amino acid oxidase-like deaminating enzyme